MKQYIISPVTTLTIYDNDEEMFATKLGIEGKTMPLHYTVWGATEIESRERAERLGKILTAHYDENTIKTRIEAAQNYLDTAEGMYCDGPVFSESGWGYKEVMTAINIAAGIPNPTENQ